jgi:type III secretion protein U
MAEKNIDPTPHKLQDARKKGQVPVSKDVAACVLLGMGMEAAFALEDVSRQRLSELFDLSLRATQADFMTVLSGAVTASGWLLMLSFLIYAGIGLVAGVLGYWGQFGPNFSAEPLVPSIDKLNPINTIKNIFSMRKVMEILMALFKLVAIGLLSYVVIRSELPALVGLAGGNASHSYGAAVEMIRGLFHILLGVTACIAIIDFFVQRRAHQKQLRMNMEEVIREFKENEGDPLIKGARKEFAFELLYSDPVSKTEQANAVVINPTHFAVAMLFDPQSAPVPVVCAKGRDETARAMIRRAQEKGIPVIRHVWLARTLYATAKEQKPIPHALFDPVALLYSVVEQLNQEGQHYAELDDSEHPPNNLN